MSSMNFPWDESWRAGRNAWFQGLLVGIVTDNKDPDELGRVKVKYPRLQEMESDWIRVASIAAGKDRGAFFHPEVDDEVLVAFECGDINLPYVVGSLWNGKDTPPVAGEEQQTVRRIKTKTGISITLTDEEGKEKVEITDPRNNSITISSEDNTITIHSTQNITLDATEKISLKAAEISIEADTMEAKTEVSMQLETSGEMTVKGAMINLN